MHHFFIGLDHPATIWPFLRSMIPSNTIRDRKGPFRINDWMMDSGGFTELSTHGRWRTSPQQYADEINRWKDNGNLVAAVTQDLMCESFILHKTGLTILKNTKKSPSLATLAYSISQTFTSCQFSRGIRQNLTPPTLISTGNSSHPVSADHLFAAIRLRPRTSSSDPGRHQQKRGLQQIRAVGVLRWRGRDHRERAG
jgi:hypothetical protein